MTRWVPRLVGCAAGAGLAGVLVCSAGCMRDRVIVTEIQRNEEGFVIPGAFAPERMRIHPLTHSEVVGADRRVVVHMELTDGWGDTIKGLGTVRVSLGRERGGSLDLSATAWEIDIGEVEDSMRYYDPVTRTYRFVLTGLPSWFVDDTRARLIVQFRTARGDRTTDTMRDEFELVAPGAGLGG